MATYVPGSQSYLPELKTFSPDYKFLSNVIEVRQDRYDTNYKALNDLYGKVVYADLSRGDTNEVRGQYVKDIAPKIHQISDMDLSLQQNVDAAKGVFAPFFEDNLLVKDMVMTKQYRKELSYADSLLNSLDREQREKYWQTGIDAMNYQMKDFIEADRNKALQMAAPKYVEDVDLYETSIKLLQESGLFDEEISGDPAFTPDGMWQIITTGGAAVSKPALQYLRRSLLDDPNVQRAYYTSAYVEQRQFVDNGLQEGAFNDMDQAQRAWANQTITKAEEQLALLTSQQEQETAEAKETMEEREQFNNEYGNFADEALGGTMEETIAAYRAQLQGLEDKGKELSDATAYKETSGDVPTNTLLNRAYQLMMGTNIDSDLQAAAYTFGESKKTVELKVNPYKEMQIKYQYDLALENKRHSNNMALQKAKEDAEKAQQEQLSLTQQVLQNVTTSDSPSVSLEGDAVTVNEIAIGDYRNQTQQMKINTVVAFKSELKDKAGNLRVFEIDGKQYNEAQLRQYYANNPEALASDYVYVESSITDVDGSFAKAHPNGATDMQNKYRGVVRFISNRDASSDNTEQEVFSANYNNLQVALNYSGEDSDLDLSINKENVPTIINKDENGRYSQMTREEYVENFVETLRNNPELIRVYKDKWLDFKGPVDVGSLADRGYQRAVTKAMFGTQALTSVGISGAGGAPGWYQGDPEEQRQYIEDNIDKVYETLANEAYSEQQEAINEGYTITNDLNEKIAAGETLSTSDKGLAERGYTTYNAEAALAGNDPTQGLSYIETAMNYAADGQNIPAAGSAGDYYMSNFFTDLNQPEAVVHIHESDFNDKDFAKTRKILKTSSEEDVAAKKLIEQWQKDYAQFSAYDGDSLPNKANPTAQFSKYYHQDNDGNGYQVYSIDFDRDWLKSQVSNGLISESQLSEGGFDQITVVIDDNYAAKSQALSTANESYVERQMAVSGEPYVENVAYGGQIRVSDSFDEFGTPQRVIQAVPYSIVNGQLVTGNSNQYETYIIGMSDFDKTDQYVDMAYDMLWTNQQTNLDVARTDNLLLTELPE